MLARADVSIFIAMQKNPWASDRWLPVSIAPTDKDLEVCVIDGRDIHALVFPCRKSGGDWVDAVTKKRLDIQPTHWRIWSEKNIAT